MSTIVQGSASFVFLLLIICATSTTSEENTSGIIESNSIQKELASKSKTSSNEKERRLKRVFLSNLTVTCNDGSQAGFYLRKSPGSHRWVVYLEGGWYCYDQPSCRNRWLRLRHYMTSTQWPLTRDVGGILSPHPDENPFWHDANHVLIPYCSSDIWSGTKGHFDEKNGFRFMGRDIIRQVITDLLPLGLDNSTDLILAGSSAGGTGVMVNLDYVQDFLSFTKKLKTIRVKGISDSGWFLDREPYGPGAPAAVEAVRTGWSLWEGALPKRCVDKHFKEPWRCYFGHRIYPTLIAPLFVFQWLFDEAQMKADNVGAPVTPAQWDYIHRTGKALRESLNEVKAVFAPSCISHSVLPKRDWIDVKINDISVAQAIRCWDIGDKKERNLTMIFEESNFKGQPEQHGQRRHRKQKNNKKKKKCRRGYRLKKTSQQQLQPTSNPNQNSGSAMSPSMSILLTTASKCPLRLIERCSWPQCNHSCPRLANPFTGEEMDFLELLQSFGLDMEGVAKALGIDMQTLNTMDHSKLLNLLTQQAS